jgi:hypothetical protein
LDKAGFAEIPDSQNPSGDGKDPLGGLHFLVRLGPKGFVEIFGGMGDLKVIGVGIDPFLSQNLQLPDSLLK